MERIRKMEGATEDEIKFLDEVAKNGVVWPADWCRMTGQWGDGRGPTIDNPNIVEHLKSDYRPAIPMEVACVMYLIRDAFDDVDVAFNALRPILVVNWR